MSHDLTHHAHWLMVLIGTRESNTESRRHSLPAEALRNGGSVRRRRGRYDLIDCRAVAKVHKLPAETCVSESNWDSPRIFVGPSELSWNLFAHSPSKALLFNLRVLAHLLVRPALPPALASYYPDLHSI